MPWYKPHKPPPILVFTCNTLDSLLVNPLGDLPLELSCVLHVNFSRGWFIYYIVLLYWRWVSMLLVHLAGYDYCLLSMHWRLHALLHSSHNYYWYFCKEFCFEVNEKVPGNKARIYIIKTSFKWRLQFLPGSRMMELGGFSVDQLKGNNFRHMTAGESCLL